MAYSRTSLPMGGQFGARMRLRLDWGCLFLSERAVDNSVPLQDGKCQSLAQLAVTKKCNGAHKIKLEPKE